MVYPKYWIWFLILLLWPCASRVCTLKVSLHLFLGYLQCRPVVKEPALRCRGQFSRSSEKIPQEKMAAHPHCLLKNSLNKEDWCDCSHSEEVHKNQNPDELTDTPTPSHPCPWSPLAYTRFALFFRILFSFLDGVLLLSSIWFYFPVSLFILQQPGSQCGFGSHLPQGLSLAGCMVSFSASHCSGTELQVRGPSSAAASGGQCTTACELQF